MMKFTHGLKLKSEETIFDSRIHPDGEIVAVATIDSHIRLYRHDSIVQELQNHHGTSAIRKVRFSSNGKLLTCAKHIKIYDLESKRTSRLKVGDDCKDKIYSMEPLGRNMISAGYDSGAFRLWDTRQGKEPIFCGIDNQNYITDIASDMNVKRHVYLTSGDGTVSGYDLRKMECLDDEPTLFDTSFQCLKLTRSKRLLIGTDSGMLYVFDRKNFRESRAKVGLADDPGNRGLRGINVIESILDDQTYLAGCEDGRLRSFTYDDNQFETIDLHQVFKNDQIESMQIDPKNDHQLIVSGSKYVQWIIFDENDDTEDQNNQNNNTNVITEEKSDYLNLFK